MNNKKSFFEIERGATMTGQVLGVIAFIAVYEFLSIGISVLLGSADIGTLAGIVLGAWGYYAMLKKYQKK